MAQGTVNIWKKYIYINSDIEGKVKNICEDIDSFCFFLSFFFFFEIASFTIQGICTKT